MSGEAIDTRTCSIRRGSGHGNGKQDFHYVADEDIYVCPAGEKLAYHYTTEENSLVLRRYWTNVCQSCAIKPTRQGTTDHPMGT